MPATEQTWRDQKLMHVVFGVSSLLMLGATIWMLAADHNREWKGYQRTVRDIDAWSTDARIAQTESPEFKLERKNAELALAAAQLEIPAKEDAVEFGKAMAGNPTSPGYDKRKADFDRRIGEPYERMTQQTDREAIRPLRAQLIQEMSEAIRRAKFEENNALTAKKFRSADLDKVKSDLDLAIAANASQAKLDELQKIVDEVKADVDEKVQVLQEMTLRRKRMQAAFDRITAAELAAKKRVDDLDGTIKRLADAKAEREYDWTKRFVDAPIVSAFNAPSKIDNIWLPNLTINNNFRDVARYDRCTTCHQSIEKTAAGSAVLPAYEPEETLHLSMSAPAQPPADFEKLDSAKRLYEVFGISLVETSLFDPSEVRVQVVRSDSPAAQAGVQLGDQITGVNDLTRVSLLSDAYNQLVTVVNWGKPIQLTVLRGFSHPYASHPRLDLYLGSTSPHLLKDVGCTICHDGQGSATAFKFASHTPDSPRQAKEWRAEHGWFSSHDWIFPMTSKRFVESMCLKCHHDVVELEPSDRFPDPPAAKLVEGYNNIRQYGCFGCHEINGFDGPTRRIGPDMRAEPNYVAAAEALLISGALSDEQKGWAREVIAHVDRDGSRRLLADSIKNAPPDEQGNARYELPVRKLGGLLEDVEAAGKLRKVGPSLRHVASKVDYEWLYSWVRRPRDFRDSTKMPQFFGQYEHLEKDEVAHTQKLEGIEIRGISEYLLSRSQPYRFEHRLPSDVADPSAERGKKLFETRGCLACHQHADFPEGKMSQGPDLSRIGGKLDREANRTGGTWLYNWLKNPSAYHPRTLMPNLILDPLDGAEGQKTDPAADIAVYLLASGKDWQPKDVPPRDVQGLSAAEQASLEELAFDYLRAAVPNRRIAEGYLKGGIPESQRADFKGDEVELVGSSMTNEKKLLYVGRRALSKYGCAGCHDVPGFEDAKPIGTGLADWGRKAADKLAFEQINEFIQHHGSHDDHGDLAEARDQDRAYFIERLEGHDRQGFLWQKLHAPRTFDYMKTANKGYNERLRMPKFNLTEEQIQEVMTFVLGLVSEPPAPQYVYKSQGRRSAIIEGQRLVEKYNCTGCHTMKLEKWEMAYLPTDFPEPGEVPDFSFLEPRLPAKQLKDSLVKDAAGRLHGTLVGMPKINPETNQPLLIDEDGSPIEPGDTTTRAFYIFTPYETSALAGHVRPAGVQNLIVPADRIVKKYPAWGGYLPRLIFSSVVNAAGTKDKADESWGWLPPPLAGEGRKVQSEWLHDFLLEPHPIRPAAILRMPKFNMSSAEASTLATYFAAVDGSEYPYHYDSRTSTAYLEEQERKHPNHLADAMKLVVSADGCVKCHLVGDFVPAGSDRAKSPRLDQVYKRLRPDYLRDWIGNPKRILPYTAMLTPLSATQPKFQDLYRGSSVEQLDALVDLLVNYDRFVERQTSVKSQVKPAPAPAANNAAASN